MERKELFSKFKDYNTELENILETKDYPESAKNLLLSMLYKIEASYKDYAKVKVNVKTKKKFIEEILKNIKENCEQIEVISLEESSKNINVIKDEKKIILYASEKEMLKAIANISNKKSDIGNEYFYLEKPFQELIEIGNAINAEEIIRDFDGWSWDVQNSQIKNYEYNLVYQILIILFGENEIDSIIQNSDCINKIKKKLDEKSKNEISKYLIQIIIGIYIHSNIENRRHIEKIKEETEKNVKEMQDKILLIEKISNEKKEYTKQIKEFDKILGNRTLIIEEYKERNRNASQENRIFSVSDLADIIEKERNAILTKIEELNQKINPDKYTKQKEIFENANKILQIALSMSDEDWNDLQIDFQKSFITYMLKKIQSLTTKKEIMDFIYIFRYYLFIPIDEKRSIKDVKELEKNIENVIYVSIKKAIILKLMNIVHEDLKINSEILKPIFFTKIIDLEDVQLEIKKEKECIKIIIGEQESIENERTIELESEKELKLKYDKRIKIFN